MDTTNWPIVEQAVNLLSTIVWFYVGQSKQYSKSKPFEIEIQTILLEGNFIPRLIELITAESTPESIFIACLNCFCQYPPQIELQSADIRRILSVLNRKLTSTVHPLSPIHA